MSSVNTLEFSKTQSEFLYNLLKSGSAYFAVGQGEASWDSLTPNPDKERTQLVNEFDRVKLTEDDIKYIIPNSNPDEESSESTGLLRVLGRCSKVGTPIREYGIFYNGTAVKNSGNLILYGTHNKITLAQMTVFMKYMYINFIDE